MKCQATYNLIECKKKARFKIVDLNCGNEDGDYEPFWVCDDCIRFFIECNKDFDVCSGCRESLGNPHYILLEDLKNDKK